MTRTYEVCYLVLLGALRRGITPDKIWHMLTLGWIGCDFIAELIANQLCDCGGAQEVQNEAGDERFIPPGDSGLVAAHRIQGVLS